MKIKKVTPDIYVLTGQELNSNATLITCEDKVLLVDGLASKNDAEELKKFIRQDLQKELHLSFVHITSVIIWRHFHYFSQPQ